MKVLDERVRKEATLFCELNVGDVFEELNSSDGTVWIKAFSKPTSIIEDYYNAFILGSNELDHAENRFGYFDADTPVRKLDVELTILGEAE